MSRGLAARSSWPAAQMINGHKILHYIKPMLATAVDKPFSDKDWLFELKLDGYRAIAVTGQNKLLLYSRSGLSFTQKYPAIAAALKKIKTPAVLDGEIVLLNEEGHPDFQKLQNYNKRGDYQLVYYVFDILSCRQRDLTHQPLVERKKILKKILKKSDVVRFCSHIEENGKDFFKTIRAEDMEGMIAKKKDSLYVPGLRTREWLKIKNHKSQEAIIAGFTEPKGSRMHFGSLILAEYKNRKLKYIGHAGTGFNETTLKDLMKKMKPLISKESPFDSPIQVNNKVTWLKPELVCEVGFSEITRDGILRHPVYKGLRPEKTAVAVTQETEQSLPVTAVVPSAKQKK
jgi:bifunctional non-homologous end joining protein LigD